VKISSWRSSVEVIKCLNFCRSRLKVLFIGSIFHFLGLASKNLGGDRSFTPQKAHLCAEYAFLSRHCFGPYDGTIRWAW